MSDRAVSTQPIAAGIDMGGSGVKGAQVDLTTGLLVGERRCLASPSPSTPLAVAEVVAPVAEGVAHAGAVTVMMLTLGTGTGSIGSVAREASGRRSRSKSRCRNARTRTSRGTSRPSRACSQRGEALDLADRDGLMGRFHKTKASESTQSMRHGLSGRADHVGQFLMTQSHVDDGTPLAR